MPGGRFSIGPAYREPRPVSPGGSRVPAIAPDTYHHSRLTPSEWAAHRAAAEALEIRVIEINWPDPLIRGRHAEACRPRACAHGCRAR
jgi:hypothetical protein